MSIRNKVQLVGNVGMNPEIKILSNGSKLARVSIATNERYKNKTGEWVENTTWHNLIGWRDMADRLEKSVNKGHMLLIEGKLINRKYQDKDNVLRYMTEIEVRNFIVLDKKGGSVEKTAHYAKASVEDDDLPF
ncbi:single-stranded DNA-binding protein [Flavobacteriaceae bacterium Ap0902]|nr:single-stranded DNA-binding protein [Flavobacteriaceae bacterium Ap0902]